MSSGRIHGHENMGRGGRVLREAGNEAEQRHLLSSGFSLSCEADTD